MSRVEVDLDVLERSGASLRSVALTVTGLLTQLDADLRPLVEHWPTPVRDVHTVSHRQWSQATVALAQVLSRTVAGLEQAHETYRATEAAAQRRWA